MGLQKILETASVVVAQRRPTSVRAPLDSSATRATAIAAAAFPRVTPLAVPWTMPMHARAEKPTAPSREAHFAMLQKVHAVAVQTPESYS